MNVLHPGLLLSGVLLMAVPILIHYLLRRRRAPVQWAAMRFVLEAYQQRRRKLTMEQLIVLVARCLLVLLIGLGLAGPMAASAFSSNTEQLHIFVLDNSIVSNTQTGSQRDLDRNKAVLQGELEALESIAGDRVGIVTIGGPAELLTPEPLVDFSTAARLLDQIEQADSGPDWTGVAGRVAEIVGETLSGRPLRIVVASAWRQGTDVDAAAQLLERLPAGATVSITAPTESSALNTSIASFRLNRRVASASGGSRGDDSAALGQIGAVNAATIQLVRSGSDVLGEATQSVEIRELRTDRLVGRAQAGWAAGEAERTLTVPIDLAELGQSPDGLVLEASVRGDALDADDTRFASVELRRAIRVGIVEQVSERSGSTGVLTFSPGDWIETAIAPGRGVSGIEVERLGTQRLTRTRLGTLDAAFVLNPALISDDAWIALASFVQAGGLVVVTPDRGDEVLGWTEQLVQLVDDLTIRSGLRAFDPETSVIAERASLLVEIIRAEIEGLAATVSVSQSAVLEIGSEGQQIETLLSLAGGQPWLVAVPKQRGRVIVLASAIDPAWTDLAARPLMVPLLQEIVRQGISSRGELRELDAGEAVGSLGRVFRLQPWTERDGLSVFEGSIEEASASFGPIQDAGVWRGVSQDDRTVGTVLVQPDSAYARTTPDSIEPLTQLAAQNELSLDMIGTEAGRDSGERVTSRGSTYAWLVLVFAAALAVFETVMARRASAHELGRSRRRDARPIGAGGADG